MYYVGPKKKYSSNFQFVIFKPAIKILMMWGSCAIICSECHWNITILNNSLDQT